MSDIQRRDFLRQVAAWSAGALLTAPIFRVAGRAAAAPATASKVVVARGEDYDKLVGRALDPLGGLAAFVKKGAKVVVKPNIGWDRKPEQAATTHPLVVRALVQGALAAGAAQVLVFDRTCNDARRCYASSGIEQAVQSIGDGRARCVQIDERKWVPVKIARATSLHEWEFYRDALDADCYVNVPIAKHHGIARLTLGLKNVMGVIGGNRGKLHKAIGPQLADCALVVKPHLTVIDATRILLRNGPQGGSLDDVKVLHTLVASTDPVAADAYATTLFGLKPGDIDSTRAAHAAGLGEMDLERVQIVRV